MRPALQVQEQRREQRRPASGAAVVRTTGAYPIDVAGRLVDISSNGFRMAHGSMDLETGTVVEFEHGEASGSARVVWNRITGEGIETGFFVVERG